MKQYLKLTLFHINRIFKDPKSMLLIILPVALSLLMSFVMNSDKSPQLGKVAFLCESNYFTQTIYPELAPEHQGRLVSSETEAEQLLDQGKVAVVYQIPEDFEETGHLQALSANGEIENQYVERAILQQWQADHRQSLLKDYHVQLSQKQAPEIQLETAKEYLPLVIMVSLFMIFYMMYINASMFAGDLLDMRNNFVLKRSLVSKSPGKAILGSVLSAYGLIFLFLNLLAFSIVIWINHLSLNLLGLIIGYFVVNVAFVIGYILLMVRIFKNKQVLSSISMVIAIMFVALPQILEGSSFEALSMISPFYWTMEGLDYATFFPQGLVILLMAIALFTAGSFKVEELARVS